MTLQTNPKIRNIAIIAHVDHGKTTLVDHLFKQSGMFRSNQEVADRLMDSMDLERERGITISAKNCSVLFGDIKINIIDTPGHADFGGEVERSLKMADGVVLLVDAAEGPLPQTRFVLQKALAQKMKVITVVNKIDRKDARPREVLDEIYSLFIDVGADDDTLDFPVIYAIGRDGIAKKSLDDTTSKDLKPLFEQIIESIPAPSYDDAEPFQMLVCNVGFSEYTGKLAIGKVFNGSAKRNDQLVCVGKESQVTALRVNRLQLYEGPKHVDTEEVQPGDIVILSGADEVTIGDTICQKDNPKALPRVTVDEPTVAMRFLPNNSPLSGREGKLVQSRRIYDRLIKETWYNVAIQVESDPSGEAFIVKGRGEFQMAVLIETMRREGFELCVGRPQILFKDVNGERHEPIEKLFVECATEFTGAATEKLSKRKGRMLHLENLDNGRTKLEFSIPSRGLIGYRNEFLTDTKGTGILNSYLEGYEPYRGDIESRQTGSLVSDRSGNSVPYALFGLEERGKLMIEAGVPVYEGMIIGENAKAGDMYVNAVREKKLTNIRAAGKDENVTLTNIQPVTLEQAIEFIKDDELVEVTPKSIRMRKAILDKGKCEQAKKAAG